MADLSYLKTNAKPLAILGLGVSGKAVADACKQVGVPYHAWVDDEASQNALKATYALHDFSDDLSPYQALVTAAGIKPSHPVLQKAKEQGIAILSDIDLLYSSAPDATYIGITGTNGKSTTTALIGHILKEAGKNVAMGGNIGLAACSLPSLAADGIYVLELSSYQLEITKQPIYDIVALLNITPDHLDWHGDMAHYTAAKKKIFRTKPNTTQTAVIAVDNDAARDIAAELKNSAGHYLVTVSEKDAPLDGHDFLKGAHNRENMAVAFAVCRAVGLADDEIVKHIATFQGLAHRQKLVASSGEIVFINDSKGTNVDSTAKALDSYDAIYWIVGGIATAQGLDGLENYFPKIRHAFLIGEASERFAKKLDGQVAYTVSGDMAKAVADAFALAQKNGGRATILLSPASKSFDQYKNFEERGDHFERLAKEAVKRVAA